MNLSPSCSKSPILDCHSSNKLTIIGLEDFEVERENSERAQNQTEVEDELKNGDIEFAFVCTERNASFVAADEIFYNGKIRSTCPITDKSDLLSERNGSGSGSGSILNPPCPIWTWDDVNRLQLWDVLFEDGVSKASSSSKLNEVDDCVWREKERSKKSWMKSNMLKTWKFRNILHQSNRCKFQNQLQQSNSESKDKNAVVAPSNAKCKKKSDNIQKATEETRVTKLKETWHVLNGAPHNKEQREDKRRSSTTRLDLP